MSPERRQNVGMIPALSLSLSLGINGERPKSCLLLYAFRRRQGDHSFHRGFSLLSAEPGHGRRWKMQTQDSQQLVCGQRGIFLQEPCCGLDLILPGYSITTVLSYPTSFKRSQVYYQHGRILRFSRRRKAAKFVFPRFRGVVRRALSFTFLYSCTTRYPSRCPERRPHAWT